MKSIVWFFVLIACYVPSKSQNNERGDVVITPYTTTLFTGGMDTASIMIYLSDFNGNMLNESNTIEIALHGNGRLVGSDEQLKSINDTTLLVSLSRGKVHFKLLAGNYSGKLIIEAKCPGFWPAKTEIHAIAPFPYLKPSSEQLLCRKINPGKMMGADISFLPQLEKRGLRFFDAQKEGDALEILKRHGINYIRLRIFHNPSLKSGYAPGEGFCDLFNTLKMAKRVKDAGLKLLLDFHYSDYWADPQQQYKPDAWKNADFKVLCDSVREYTANILFALKKQGCIPDMVQVGNEINHGLLWPDGHIGNPDKLARLLSAGVEGIKRVDSTVLVMMHVALGGQNKESVFWYDNMLAREVKFDVIGLSYYPRWHGSLEDLQSNITDLIKRYNKEIFVVEYSVRKEEIADIVFRVPGGMAKGICIWEPLNTWDQVFDRDGKSNEKILLFDRIRNKYLYE